MYVLKPGVVADTYNFNNLGAETGGLLLIGDQPLLHSELKEA